MILRKRQGTVGTAEVQMQRGYFFFVFTLKACNGLDAARLALPPAFSLCATLG